MSPRIKEEEYARLWTGFCQTIAIESRINPRCQRQNLPYRYREDMVEFQGMKKNAL